jgi:hypothetical protein
MPSFITHICTICGREKTKPGWFLLAENRWEDKLKILQWSDSLALKAEAHEVCSRAHVRELAIFWMTTGSLRYPFAGGDFGDRSLEWPTFSELNSGGSASRVFRSRRNDLDTSGAQQLGELSVHRESIRRILNDDPGSLTPILDELVLALRLESDGNEGMELADDAEGMTTRQA